jgi:hypothetical protein
LVGGAGGASGDDQPAVTAASEGEELLVFEHDLEPERVAVEPAAQHEREPAGIWQPTEPIGEPAAVTGYRGRVEDAITGFPSAPVVAWRRHTPSVVGAKPAHKPAVAQCPGELVAAGDHTLGRRREPEV